MIRNLVGTIYGKSSYKDCSFCPNLLTNTADTVWPNILKLGLKHLWELFIPLTNVAIVGNCCSISKAAFPLKPLDQMI